MTSVLENLKQLGLSPNQARVYLALFDHEEAKAGRLIKETGLHRNLVYEALQSLEEKKLVSASQVRGVALYKVLAPKRFLSDLQNKERIAKNLIEELAQKYKPQTQEITVYEGIEEFRRQVLASYSSVKAGGAMYYLGVSPEWHEIVGPALEADLIEIQKRKKFKILGLANAITKEQKDYIKNSSPFTEIRANPLISGDTSGTEILEDRISIRSFVEPYFVVEITHKGLAKNYRNYFDFLWKQ